MSQTFRERRGPGPDASLHSATRQAQAPYGDSTFVFISYKNGNFLSEEVKAGRREGGWGRGENWPTAFPISSMGRKKSPGQSLGVVKGGPETPPRHPTSGPCGCGRGQAGGPHMGPRVGPRSHVFSLQPTHLHVDRRAGPHLVREAVFCRNSSWGVCGPCHGAHRSEAPQVTGVGKMWGPQEPALQPRWCLGPVSPPPLQRRSWAQGPA